MRIKIKTHFLCQNFFFFPSWGGRESADMTKHIPTSPRDPDATRRHRFSETSSIFLYTCVVATRLELRTRMIPPFFEQVCLVYYSIVGGFVRVNVGESG